jgi:hypothetical protein
MIAGYSSSFGAFAGGGTPFSRLKISPASRDLVKSSPQILFLQQVVDVDLE